MIHNLSTQNSIASQFVAELRDINIQNDSLRFRRNLERLGEVLAYEISKTLEYHTIEVETPLGIAKSVKHSKEIVLATILRAGLPMHTGMHNYFDGAQNAFISAYRCHHKDGSFEIKLEYVSCPDMDNKILIICDPMLATGASMDIALKEINKIGTPFQTHIATAIASQDGIDHIRRIYPDATLWTADVDEELTAKSFIVPGLGDAGDLSFGPKIQK